MTKKRETRELPAAKRTEGKKRKGRASQTAIRQDCAGTGGKKPSCSESLITNERRNKESTVYTNHKKHCYNEHNTHVHCILLNARSIVRKVDELKLLVHDENSDIIFIIESWTAEHIAEAEINIPGYDLIRKDRMNKRGGGCLIYAKEELKVTVIDLASVENTESAWCLVKTRDLELVVGVCYLSPSAGQDEEIRLYNYISEICNSYNNIVITGYFNHISINCETLHSQKERESFLNLTLDCCLTQHVKEPTRGGNILDLVLSKPGELVEYVEITEPLGTSDHNVAKFKIPVPIDEDNWKTEYYDYRQANIKHMRHI